MENKHFVEVLEKLDNLARRINTNISKYNSPNISNKIKVNLENKYYERLLEFKGICLTDVDENNTVYDVIKERVINAYAKDSSYFQIPKPPKIKDIKDCVIFEVLNINYGGLAVNLDNEATLLPLFGDMGETNLSRLIKLFNEPQE